MNARALPVAFLLAGLAITAPAAGTTACPDTLDVTVRTLVGNEAVRLCDQYAGKVVLVVNTASYCGFTPQYDGLEKLYCSASRVGGRSSGPQAKGVERLPEPIAVIGHEQQRLLSAV